MPPPIAPSQVHTIGDIRLIMRGLLAAHESTRRMFDATPVADAYNDGFRSAMLLVAESLNVELGIASMRSDRW